jgi:hypothetical protein
MGSSRHQFGSSTMKRPIESDEQLSPKVFKRQKLASVKPLKICITEGCQKQTLYGAPGERAVRCGQHRTQGMENVKTKTCEHEGCRKQPNFGVPGGKPTWCAGHKALGMENIKTKRCEAEGCKKKPSFGCPDGSPVRCAEHKAIGMVLQRSPCEANECTKWPSYGVPGHGPTRCSPHKLDGMKYLEKFAMLRVATKPTTLACQTEQLSGAWSTRPTAWSTSIARCATLKVVPRVQLSACREVDQLGAQDTKP